MGNPKTDAAYRRAFTLKEEGKGWNEILDLLKLEGFTDSNGNPFAKPGLASQYSTIKRKKPERWAEIMGSALSDEHDAVISPPAVETERASHDEHDVTISPEPIDVMPRYEHDVTLPHNEPKQPGYVMPRDERDAPFPPEAATPRYEHDVMVAPEYKTSHDERDASQAVPCTRDELAEFIRAIVREETTSMQTTATYTNEQMPPEPETLKGTRGRKENRDYQRLTTAIDKELFKLFSAECNRRKMSTGKLLDAILWNRYGKPKLSYGPTAPTDQDAS